MTDVQQPGAFGRLNAGLETYTQNVKDWVGHLASRYAIGLAMIVAGLFGALSAGGIGGAALLHWLTITYGTYPAYAMFGGGLLLLGVLIAFVGVQLIKQPVKPFPDVTQPINAAKNALTATLATRLAAIRRPPDHSTQLLAVASGLLLMGWAIGSFWSRRRNG